MMNKKIFRILMSLLVVSLMITPLALAKPGEEKNNDKFEFFQLIVSGTGDEPEKAWLTPGNIVDPLDNKTTHVRGAGWITGNKVELTVDSVTYTKTTDPVRVDYDTNYDADVIRKNDGTIQVVHVRLIDVVTVYVNDVAIGTLVLKIKAMGTIGDAGFAYSGNIVGYGTGDLEGVQISAIDQVLPPTFEYTRIGTITSFPDLPPLV